ncbi:SufE family protein [Agarivorans albus]|uniref:Cysteine desulfurase CsdA-CsdE n=1 Tax=Agarivorans albus MKT 106 TaxID=1331007 RepID=R9PHB0_AGAAL|nr:SufE family protein [Agarivorans albus]GAD00745.1 cysteine desulfurase CsdA-CsdE [Agarivorans albus MKT 106]
MNRAPQVELNIEQIEQRFVNCKSWEERYRQLLLLSKVLGPMDSQYQTQENLVQGCESNVWLYYANKQLLIDSNAKIIKGLLVIMLACFAQDAENTQITFSQTLEKLGLAHHLSESRNNGITAILQTIAKLS